MTLRPPITVAAAPMSWTSGHVAERVVVVEREQDVPARDLVAEPERGEHVAAGVERRHPVGLRDPPHRQRHEPDDGRDDEGLGAPEAITHGIGPQTPLSPGPDAARPVGRPARLQRGGEHRAVVDARARGAARLADEYEVIVVDDGSRDATASVVARALGHQHDPRVRLLRHERNQGYGAALRTASRHARGELVFYTDADNQFDLAELEYSCR